MEAKAKRDVSPSAKVEPLSFKIVEPEVQDSQKNPGMKEVSMFIMNNGSQPWPPTPIIYFSSPDNLEPLPQAKWEQTNPGEQRRWKIMIDGEVKSIKIGLRT